jgi:CheY-like chemotaxis protein
MPGGGRLVLRGKASDGSIVVTCQDTGAGMPPEVQERIFEPFFTTKGQRGNGMGLAILNGVVRRHGGEVQVSSQVGVGTIFTLRFPAAAPTSRPPAPSNGPAIRARAAARAATADELAASLAPLAVLVVEDDPIFRAVFTRRLGLDARHVEAVPDASSALVALETARWDVVCVDDRLPDRPGRALAAEIRRRQPDCTIILVTGAATAPDDPSLAGPGVDAVLPKPCTDAELAQALRLARDRQATARQVTPGQAATGGWR